MKIRALTGFLDPDWPLDNTRIEEMAACLSTLREALEDSNYEVQTLRLATSPPSEMEHPVPPSERADFARALEAEIFVHGLDYAAIGPALPDEPEGYETAVQIIGATKQVFTSGIFADPSVGLSLHAARACAQSIVDIARLESNGFGNLRFAALANVPAGAPFFPAAYHRSGPSTIAIACEAADLAVLSLQDSTSLSKTRSQLINVIESQAAKLEHIIEREIREFNIRFHGIDFSLAPFPEPERSLGTAMEGLGVTALGEAGSVAAAAFFASNLDQASFKRAGFCGLFIPVLEDSVLAKRAADGTLTIKDLLLYSTLCGTGLDTVPLPGDTSAEAITGLLLDLGVLALRHSKPLTARLMPIPGKRAGDEVHFDFPYFADSKVMSLPAQPLTDQLAGSGALDIEPPKPS
jgi:uncharacterized protein (UPF0210 family)